MRSDGSDDVAARLLGAQAVVFDCDGVLLDTEPLWEVAERAAVESLGLPWAAALRVATRGASVPEAAAVLARSAGRPDASGILAVRIEEEFVRLIGERGPTVLPGAADLVDRLHGVVPLGVASNNAPPLLRRLLAESGLIDAFRAVVGVTAPLRPKPHRDVYVAACRQLAADPRRCVALEDSPTGIAAAAAAGLTVVAVGPAHEPPATLATRSLEEAVHALGPIQETPHGT